MAAPKGRQQREQSGENVLFARISDEAVAVLDAGAAALGISRAAYVEMFLKRVTVDERGLPEWVAVQVDSDQLPFLPPLTAWVERLRRQKEAQRSAA